MKKIYLDHNATTPVDPRVFQKMKPYFEAEFGNPSSESHVWGWTAQKAVQEARKNVADLIGAQPYEIVFTAGSTEATNLAIVGLVLQLKLVEGREKIHCLTTAVEHSCVLESFRFLKKLGVDVEILPTNAYGQLEPATLEAALKPETVLVSAIWINNEIGTVNPVEELGAICRKRNVFFHTDATQAVGKLPINLETLPVDMLSLSAHKMYGPKGAGALYVRGKNPHVKIHPLSFGGGQERGMRAGTLNVSGIVGLGETARLLATELAAESARLRGLQTKLIEGLKRVFPDLRINGHPVMRSPINVSITLPTFPLELATPYLLPVAFSKSSACHSGAAHGSHVLEHIGVTAEMAARTLRFGLGRSTTEAEIDETIGVFQRAVDLVHQQQSVRIP